MRTVNGVRSFQAMVPMRDGARLNTFVYLPQTGGPRLPVILQRTPYGITSSEGKANTDCAQGWLPSADAPMRGSILRGYQLTINLAHIHHTIRAGNRIEVDVTSSNFPRRARNTNSGNPILANDTEVDIRIARNVVHHDEATPSFIEIPVIAK